MSFSSDARRELTREPLGDRAAAASELAAALMSLGAVSFRGKDRYSISFTVDSASIIRYFFSQIKRHFGVVCEIRTIRTTQLGQRLRYRLIVPDEACLSLLTALDMRDASALFGIRATPSPALLAGEGCREAFLRGAFMVCGSVTNPERAYHMEFAVGSEPLADEIMYILRLFEIYVKITCRKGQYVVYLKESERIGDLLARIGAHKAMLQIENVRIQKQMVNLVNRQVNCDTNNIRRTVNSAEAQIQDIRYIDEQMGLDKLSKPLRDMAAVRLRYPDTALAGLGEKLNPPIGKSGVNNRLRRLTAIAEKLRSGDDVEG